LYTVNRWCHEKHELPSPHRKASPQPTRVGTVFTGDLSDKQVTLHRVDHPTPPRLVLYQILHFPPPSLFKTSFCESPLLL
ncbi:hypothetical protein AVEN_249956-1, partial [Araneus ventricosus]